MKEKRRVFIAEDHAVLRQGLRALLDAGGEFEVVGEAEDGAEAVRRITASHPDLVLLDLNMPKMDGISVIKDLKKRYPEIKILVLTMFKTEEYVLEVFHSGAEGYCLKSSSYDELLMGIRAVLSGKRFISPEISDSVLEGYIEGRKTVKEKSSWDTLTQREREVLKSGPYIPISAVAASMWMSASTKRRRPGWFILRKGTINWKHIWNPRMRISVWKGRSASIWDFRWNSSKRTYRFSEKVSAKIKCSRRPSDISFFNERPRAIRSCAGMMPWTSQGERRPFILPYPATS